MLQTPSPQVRARTNLASPTPPFHSSFAPPHTCPYTSATPPQAPCARGARHPPALPAPSTGQESSQKLIHTHSCSSPAPTSLLPKRAFGQDPPLLTHSQELVPELACDTFYSPPACLQQDACSLQGSLPPFTLGASQRLCTQNQLTKHGGAPLHLDRGVSVGRMFWGTGQEDGRF